MVGRPQVKVEQFQQGTTGGGGGLRARAPPAFHTLAKDMSLNRGATHFTHVLSHPIYYKYTCAPLSKLLSCAPSGTISMTILAWWIAFPVL